MTNEVEGSNERLRTPTRWWLVSVSIICGLLTITVPFEMMAAMMMSDGGPTPFLNLLIFWALAYPVVLLVTPIASWHAYGAGAYGRAWRWSLGVPGVWIAGLVTLSFMVSRYGHFVL